MSFTSEANVRAVRKRYSCDACGTNIEVGQPASRWAGMTDGDFGTAIYHPECRVAETAYNLDILDWMSSDDWFPLSEIDGESLPWLLENHPVAAQRLSSRFKRGASHDQG